MTYIFIEYTGRIEFKPGRNDFLFRANRLPVRAKGFRANGISGETTGYL